MYLHHSSASQAASRRSHYIPDSHWKIKIEFAGNKTGSQQKKPDIIHGEKTIHESQMGELGRIRCSQQNMKVWSQVKPTSINSDLSSALPTSLRFSEMQINAQRDTDSMRSLKQRAEQTSQPLFTGIVGNNIQRRQFGKLSFARVQVTLLDHNEPNIRMNILTLRQN